jgi:phosphoglycerol transferase MdoB-like AlkP superfamily enzyme
VADRLRVTLGLAAIQLAISAALRGIFAVAFRDGGAGASWIELARAWQLGLRFDLRLALLVSLPFLALSWMPSIDPGRHRAGRTLWTTYFVIVEALVLTIHLVDFGHYAYLGTRIDAGLLEHLRPPSIAARMLWESYPVLWASLALGAFAAAYAAATRALLAREASTPATRPSGWAGGMALGATIGLYALGLYGAWSWYPLRWSAAYFSPNGYLAALALNPVLFFVDTLPDRERVFDAAAVREGHAELAALLGVDSPDRETLSLARYVEPAPRPGRPLNLVLIHLESFAAFKTGVLGNALGATPAFDAIARSSLLFTHFFTPAGATARAVFGLITGIPDLHPGDTASRNPRIVDQHTLVTALVDHEKLYFLGGSAAWGNIRGLLSHNIDGLRIFEEGDYEAPREDTWGVSDLAVFEKANDVLRRASRPFFALIQTAGNHRPYTIPTERGTFEPVHVDDATLRANQFDSLAAYNGIRLLDYSLGRFFELARREAYFDHTIFVMYGDHGVYPVIALPWQQIGLADRWVPLVIHAPALIPEGRRIATVASLVDVLPTCLGLMGIPYLNTTLGRDLLAPHPARAQFALAGGGLLTNDFLLRVDPRGHARLHRYRSARAPWRPRGCARCSRGSSRRPATCSTTTPGGPMRRTGGSRPRAPDACRGTDGATVRRCWRARRVAIEGRSNGTGIDRTCRARTRRTLDRMPRSPAAIRPPPGDSVYPSGVVHDDRALARLGLEASHSGRPVGVRKRLLVRPIGVLDQGDRPVEHGSADAVLAVHEHRPAHRIVHDGKEGGELLLTRLLTRGDVHVADAGGRQRRLLGGDRSRERLALFRDGPVRIPQVDDRLDPEIAGRGHERRRRHGGGPVERSGHHRHQAMQHQVPVRIRTARQCQHREQQRCGQPPEHARSHRHADSVAKAARPRDRGRHAPLEPARVPINADRTG